MRGRSSPLDAIVEVGPDLDRVMATESSARPDVGPRSADDRYLLYTGGTTGPPKGVVWRHEDIYFAVARRAGHAEPGSAAAHRARARSSSGCGGATRSCGGCPLCPLIHGGAMWVALQTLLNGGALVLDTVSPLPTPPTAVGLLSDERVELTMLIGDATARPIADELAADRDAADLPLRPLGAAGDRVRRRGAVGLGRSTSCASCCPHVTVAQHLRRLRDRGPGSAAGGRVAVGPGS